MLHAYQYKPLLRWQIAQVWDGYWKQAMLFHGCQPSVLQPYNALLDQLAMGPFQALVHRFLGVLLSLEIAVSIFRFPSAESQAKHGISQSLQAFGRLL